MSSVRGTISIDVAFTDSTTVGGAQSLKTITLRDSTEYTSGKVAIVTGTVGTAAVMLFTADGQGIANAYKTASGQQVGVIFVARVALRGSGSGVIVEDADLGQLKLLSQQNQLAIGSNSGSAASIYAVDGTASYTVVLYGT